MKNLLKIFLVIFLFIGNFTNITYSAWELLWNDQINLTTWWENDSAKIEHRNNRLNSIKNADKDFTVSQWWEKWIYNSIIRIARDLKNLFFMLSWLFLTILVLKLLFSSKTEEEVSNFKKWVIWISVWIIVTQIAYYFINVLFDKEINVRLAENFIDVIIKPLIYLLETWAAFFFLAIMIFAFYKMVTANWDEEKAKSWKMSIVYAIVWFIVIKVSKALVSTTYWKTNCKSIYQVNCVTDTNVTWFAYIVVQIINWMNGFVWIIVILLIIYAWFLTLTSAWDEEKLNKSKNIILYIVIWLWILITNYLILTFFIIPETAI